MQTIQPGRALVAGIGNEFRGDDAVGLLVAHRVRQLGLTQVDVVDLSDNLDTLLHHWQQRKLVVLVDAIHSGASPGTLFCLDLLCDPPPHTMTATSTHALDPIRLTRMARALNRVPQQLYLVGIEGADFAVGAEVCDAVHAALPRAVAAILALFDQAGIG